MYCEKPKLFFSLFTLLIIFHIIFISNNLYAKDTKKILIVHSYNSQYEWVQEYTNGLKDGFNKYGLSDFNLIIKNFYMDAKRYPELLKQQGKKAYDLYRIFNPDIVIAADDSAQRYFVVPYLSNKVRIPVVFFGVNADPLAYGYPSNNVTGVLERINYIEDLILVHMLVPDAKTYGIIVDNNITTRGFLERWKNNRKNLNLKFKGIYITNDFEEWKRDIIKLQREVDIIYILSYFTLKDQNGEYVNPEKIIKWYLKNSKRPETSPLLFSVREGLLCAYGESAYIQGLNAARMGFEILVKGINPKEIPIIAPKQGLRAINRRRANQLGIEIPAELIPGTVFYD